MRPEEDPKLKEARRKAAGKLVQLIIAEDDTVLMLQQVTEQLQKQLKVFQSAAHGPPEESARHQQMLLQLESEQMTLAGQLQDLRKVRASLERKLDEGVQGKPVSNATAKHTKGVGGGGGGAGGKRHNRVSPTRAATTLGFEPGGNQQRAATVGPSPSSRGGDSGDGGGNSQRQTRVRARTEVGFDRSAPRSRGGGTRSRGGSTSSEKVDLHAAELERRERATREKLRLLKGQLQNDQRALFESVAAGGGAAAANSAPRSQSRTPSTTTSRYRGDGGGGGGSNVDLDTPKFGGWTTSNVATPSSRGSLSSSHASRIQRSRPAPVDYGRSGRSGRESPSSRGSSIGEGGGRASYAAAHGVQGGVGLYDTLDGNSRADEDNDEGDDNSVSYDSDDGPSPQARAVRSPVATSPVQRENVYRSALSKQRDRVQIIRQKIRAAMTIQQAWRGYLARSRRLSN